MRRLLLRMTTEHQLTEAFFRGLVGRTLRLMVPLMLLAVSGGWYAAGAERDATALPFFLVIVAVVVPFGLYRGIRRQMKAFRSLRVEVSDAAIARTQDGLPRFEIPFEEIASLAELPGRGLTVRGRGAHQVLFLPVTLERYDEVRARLAAVRSIEMAPASRSLGWIFGAALVPIGGLILMYRSPSKPIASLAGAVVLLSVGFCAYQLARSPHVDRGMKRGLWALGLVVISVLAGLVSLIFR